MVETVVRTLQTGATVQTRHTFALVDVLLTVLTGVTLEAVTLVVVDLVHTFSTVRARVRFTLINVRLAVDAGISGGITIALESSQLIDTPSTVLAWLALTIIDIDLAQPSGHTRDAHARKVGHLIHTARSFGARITLTLINVHAAVLSCVSSRTDTFVIILLVLTLGIVLARMAQTLIHIQVAR